MIQWEITDQERWCSEKAQSNVDDLFFVLLRERGVLCNDFTEQALCDTAKRTIGVEELIRQFIELRSSRITILEVKN